MAIFDRVADVYDVSRGGDRRGAQFAVDLVRLLGPVDDLVLGVGVVCSVAAKSLVLGMRIGLTCARG